jgi:hypothetical protein
MVNEGGGKLSGGAIQEHDTSVPPDLSDGEHSLRLGWAVVKSKVDPGNDETREHLRKGLAAQK